MRAPIVLGVDLGTTKITCVAVNSSSGEILATGTVANDANITKPEDGARGHSEWDAEQILLSAVRCLSIVANQLGSRAKDLAAIGITGQQHGVVLVDSTTLKPIAPLINWQDRRALQTIPGSEESWLQAARWAIGSEAWKRTGCWLQPGFMAVTLFELHRRQCLPANSTALFIMDYFAGWLTGQTPITEPSCAGSSGVFDVHSRDWNHDAIESLGLHRSLFPQVCEADYIVGRVNGAKAQEIGLREGTPVFAAIGDHQASFLGSVADRRSSVLVNVGTGAQVAVYTDGFDFAPPIELRPCPLGGNLLSNVGLAGGWSYQVLQRFFEDVGSVLFDVRPTNNLYDVMNQLAESIAPDADGLQCNPQFSGTRLDPTVRGSITGLSPQNFTSGHLARAVLQGMGDSLHQGFRSIHSITRSLPRALVAAGNGLRENQLLAKIVARAFNLAITFTEHREEAAFGAALVASVGARIYPSVEQAGRSMIRTIERAA